MRGTPEYTRIPETVSVLRNGMIVFLKNEEIDICILQVYNGKVLEGDNHDIKRSF